MSDQPPTKYPSAPSLPTQSEGNPQEAPWQTALKYFTEVYVNGPQQTPQGEPSTAAGPLSGLQKALGWMADRALVRTSVTVESGSASNSTTARDEQSPLSKALDYVSLTVFAPEMLPSSDARSSMGVTVVRPPSRSCLREVRSAPSIPSADSARARSLAQRYQPRPSAPQLSAPAVRNRYRLKLVPSAVQRRRSPQRATSTTSRATQSDVSLLSSRSGPQYHYLSFADGQPSCCVVLPSSAPPPYQERSCCSECRCANRFPDPLEIFRTFSLAYRAFGLQQNPFGMTSLLPYWPMPQQPYYFYPPGPIVPPFDTWMSSRSSDSSCVCEQCEREARQRRLAPAKAVHDFSTLVQVAPKGKRPPQMPNMKSLSKRKAAAVTYATPSKPSDGAEKGLVQGTQGPEVAKMESQLVGESIESDADQPAVPKDSETVQQPSNNQPDHSTARSKEVPKVMQSAITATAEHTTSPEGPKATSAPVAPPLQPAEALAKVQPHLDGVLSTAQPHAQHGSLGPQVQGSAGSVSTEVTTVHHGLPSTEQSAVVEGLQPGVHEEKQPGTHEEKQPGAQDKRQAVAPDEKQPSAQKESQPAAKQPAAQENQPDRHEGKQAEAEVSPLDPNVLPGQQSDTSQDPATASMAASPKQGPSVTQPSETHLSVPQPSNLQATIPDHSTAEFSPSPVTVKSMPDVDTSPVTVKSMPDVDTSPVTVKSMPDVDTSPVTVKSMPGVDTLPPSNVPRSDSLLPDSIPETNAEPLQPEDGMQNAPEEGDNEGMMEGPIATGTTAAAVVHDGDDSSDDPSEKINAADNEEPSMADTISKRSNQSEEAGELHEHQDDSSNAEHIVDMLQPDFPTSNEQAINIEPAADVQPAHG
ncbi:hypothetical protein HPB49_024387 [Dermacentor silvarum]|uniref:Uncharacterized protein n=1 Tax=Dermacentor silvarum TaxID=543639 RepID=A0ACB8DS07_DERSI|nr:proteoglycan 4-like [Dermacentor silvarum]KAH7975135.1 hypothetical protein HPB49_024387 [Dermacentor silvarum]